MAAFLLILGLAASANAQEGDITLIVNVQDSFTGQPLNAICVSISDHQLFEFSETTGVDGSVSTSLTAGAYFVWVSDCGEGLYSEEFLEVNATGGGTILLEVELISPVEVSGTVTDVSTGDPLNRACVDLFHPDNVWSEDGDFRALSDEAGDYSLTVAAGEYFFRFSDCGDGVYADLWLESAPGSADPRPIDLGEGIEFVVDGALIPAGSIAGTVTNESTGDPVPGICVSAEDVLAGGGLDRGTAETGPHGTYEIGGLAAFDYIVHFYDCRGGDLLDEYYLDAPQYEEATAVTVESGIVTTVDAALAPAAKISGTLIDAATGDALTGVCVKLQNSEGTADSSVAGTSTNQAGTYEFDRVRAGTYRVRFSPPECAEHYGARWYPSASDVGDAALIEVGPGDDITGIDGALSPGATISGLVTDEAGNPITVNVELHQEGWAEPLSAHAFEGQFTTPPLPTGDYDVRFFDNSYVYISEWYDNVLSPDDATPVSIVTEGQEVTGIDARLALAGFVRGHVFGLRFPSEVLCLNVYDLNGRLVRFGFTGPGESYRIGGLPTGQYRMAAGPCDWDPGGGFLTVWYGGSLSESAATLIDVTAGQTTWNIDFSAIRFPGFDVNAIVGLVEGSGRWHLISGNADGDTFYFGDPSDVPVLGDWDCDGLETPGMFRPSNGFFYLSNARATSFADEEFFFGQRGDVPLAGDWNGDGCDTVGIYRPTEGKVYLRNSLTTGFADIEYVFGRPGDRPFAGDFDGNGIDEVGLHREATGRVFVRFTHTTGFADLEFYFGAAGDLMFSGDWNGDGTDTPGIYRPAAKRVFLSFSNATTPADVKFKFGDGSLQPAT